MHYLNYTQKMSDVMGMVIVWSDVPLPFVCLDSEFVDALLAISLPFLN